MRAVARCQSTKVSRQRASFCACLHVDFGHLVHCFYYLKNHNPKMSWELPYGEVEFRQDPNEYPLRALDYDDFLTRRVRGYFPLAMVCADCGISEFPLIVFTQGWRVWWRYNFWTMVGCKAVLGREVGVASSIPNCKDRL